MTNLEGLARELFNRFATKTGKRADWNYLSNERKIYWMKDVILLADYFLENIKLEFKPLSNSSGNTVYENGFNAGVRAERTLNQIAIEELHNKLLQELEEFEQTLNRH